MKTLKAPTTVKSAKIADNKAKKIANTRQSKAPTQTDALYKNGRLHDNLLQAVKQFHELVIRWGYNADSPDDISLEYEVQSWVKSAMIYGFKPNRTYDIWTVRERERIYRVFDEVGKLFRILLRPEHAKSIVSGNWNEDRKEDNYIYNAITRIVCERSDGALFLDRSRLKLIQQVFQVHTFYKYTYLNEAPSPIIKDAIDLYYILEDVLEYYIDLLEREWAKKGAA